MADFIVGDNGSISVGKKKKKKNTDFIVKQNGSIAFNIDKSTVTKKKKEEEERTWFKSGAFKDGYDFGDISKTILGTATDIQQDVTKGLQKMGEGVIDTGAYLVGGGAKLFGQDKFADDVKKFIAKDITGGLGVSEMVTNNSALGFANNLLNGNMGVYKPSNYLEYAGNILDVFDPDAELQRSEISESNVIEKNSLLGDKSDNLVQSAGQLAGTIALQSVGVPWYLTTGVSSFGGETEQAFNEGAGYLDAGGSGLVSAGAEILTEKLFGSSGLGEKGLINLEPLTKGITNKAYQSLARFGIDILAEGSEEVASEFISTIGKQLSYEREDTWNELLNNEQAMDNYINQVGESLFGKEARANYGEAFIGGAVMGGGFNVGKVANSIKTGRDYYTGYTDNEQKVIDSVKDQRTTEIQKKRAVEERVKNVIAEREGTFGTLSDAEKKNIANRVQEQLDNGELDYSTSKLTKKEIAKIEAEVQEDLAKGYIDVDTIESTLSSEKTAQIKELEAQLDKTTDTQKKAEIQAQIYDLKVSRATEMGETLKKDGFLQNSYREEALKKQKFTYEAKETDSEIRKSLAEDFKKIANDTSKTHELFETISKIAEDKQTSYGVINNEMLKELGYEVEGKDVNGLVRVNADGTQKVLINIDSSKAINRIVGHETTHLLEGTNEYTELQQMVKDYATTKGEYDAKLKEVTKLYEGTNANIENELTADLVGDYLFTDADFVNSLSVQKPSIFKKIFDEIKYLYKLATAGSKEARQLERVKKAFEDAYKKNGQQTKQQSIVDNKKLYEYTKENKMLVSATDNLAEILESGVFDAKRTSVGSYDKGTAISEYGKYKVHLKPEALDYVDKMYRGDGGTRSEFVKENKETFNNVEELINNHPQTSTGQATYDELTFKNDIPTDLIEKVEIPEGTDQSVIDMLESKGIPYEFYTPKQKSNTNEDSLLSMFGKKAQKQPTVEKPSEGLTKEQQEYFKDSVVRDEDGNLMVMYHGTSSGGHTVFDTYGSKYGLFGQGSYFTNDRSVAESYTEKGKGKNPQIYETYLNITNPIDMDAQADAESWKKALPDADFPDSGTNEDFYRAMEEYYRDAEYSKWEASEEIIDVIQGMGYDGITHIGGGRFNKADDTRHRVYIAFDSNQIKNVDNTKPTASEDIRYSLSEKGTLQDSNGNEVTLEASDTGTHGTLMVIHNLTEGKMKGIIELGGFPVPSIAITKVSNAGSNQFGDVTVVFDKSTINPLDKRNEVFDRDVWTPTFPRVEYDINTKALNRIRNLVGGYGNFYLSDANSVLNNIEYKINSYGLKNAIDEIKKSDAFKYVYLKNKDSNFEPITKTTEDQLSSYYSNEILREFAQEYGEIPRWTEISDEQRQEIVDKFKEKWQPILEAKRDKMIAEEQAKAEPRQYMINMINSSVETNLSRLDSLGGQDNFIRDLNTIQENNAVTTKIDKEATKQYFDDNIDQAEYEKWVDEQFEDITSGKGIRNDKDIFTPSGNRRTFKQTHEPYDLANIVKYMTKQKTVAGEEGFGAGSGFGTIQAQMSTRFKSIDEIRQYADKKIVPSAEEHDLTKPYSDAIHEDMASLVEYYKFKNDTYSYPIDNAGYVLNDFAGYKKQDINSLKRALQENQFNVEDIPMSLLTKIVDDVNALRDMPTDYFEAKPQRAVGLDEVQAIVIPNTASIEFKQQLQDAGLKYFEYDPSIEGDKQRVINQFDDLKFSLSNQNQDIAPVRGDIFGSDIKYDASQTEVPLDIAPFRKPFELGYIPKDPTRAESYDFDDPVQDYFNKFIPDNAVQEAQEQPKSKLRRMVDTFKGQFVNRNVEIDNLARESGNKNIKFAGDMYNNVAGEIETDVNTAQTNMEGKAIGKSIKQIFQPSKDAGLYEAFNDYLIQKSNIERHKQGKGSVIPAGTSQQLVMEYERSYPVFKTWAKDVYQYNRNILNNEVEAGLVSEDLASFLTNDIYPSYVPFYEVQDTSRYFDDRGELKPVNVLKRAKGGASQIAHIEESMIKQTYAYKRAIRQNQLYQQIVGTLDSEVSLGADVRTDPTQLNESLYVDENGNKYLTAYVKGEQKSVRITDELYNSLKNESEQRIRDLEERYSLISKPLQKVSEIRRNLLTTWSPSFVITNPLKDIQDAVFNSKYTKDMLKNYPGAFKELAMGNTDTVKQFLALYGSGNTMGEFDIEQGRVKNQKNIKFLSKIPQINNIVELAPRYAEFKASLENGTSVNEAMYNAREITTNFGRGGTITKALNRNGFTFLNASVQGMDKFIRNFSGENGAKGVVGSIAKAFIFGVAPALLNAMFFDDDEEYEALPDYIKDNYYLIKTGDGEFVRIPKGRMISVFGSAGRRTLEFAQGNEDAYEGFLKNAYSQTGVSNPLTNNIFSPLIQAYGSENGEAWYGGDLVPSRLQDKPAGEQYDETTDEFSKWLGDKLNISPYKLNYVIDQYSGGIGDLVLPTITEEASSDGSLLAPLKDKFTANSTSDNKYVSEIYTLKDELTITANGSEASEEDKLKSKYIASVTSEMGKLYGERREVQNDDSLTKAEKYEKAQAIKQEINKLAEDGLSKYENVSAMSNYATAGDKEYYLNTKNQWQKIDNDELEDLDSMGMTNLEKNSYFKTKNEISLIVSDYKEDREELDDIDKDAISMLSSEKKRNIINQIINSGLADDQKAYLYDKYYSSDKTLDTVLNAGIDFNTYLDFASQEFEADYYANGKIVTNSKKNKVISYVNSLDLSVPQKAILIRQQYSSFKQYNRQIVEYVGGLNITYEEKVALLENLDMVVDANGNVRWK